MLKCSKQYEPCHKYELLKAKHNKICDIWPATSEVIQYNPVFLKVMYKLYFQLHLPQIFHVASEI